MANTVRLGKGSAHLVSGSPDPPRFDVTCETALRRARWSRCGAADFFWAFRIAKALRRARSGDDAEFRCALCRAAARKRVPEGFFLRGQAAGQDQAVHTASDIPISAYAARSAMADQFVGVQRNTDVFVKLMRAALGGY